MGKTMTITRKEIRRVIVLDLLGVMLGMCVLASPVFAQGTQPVFDLLPEPADPVQKALRAARSRMFDLVGGGPKLEEVDPKAPTVAATVSRMPTPELPTNASHAVVIGEITAAQTHFSGNHRMLYTEYTVHLTDTMKMAQGTIDAKGDITVVQMGGAVRLPSGRVVKHEVHGWGKWPDLKARYAFFLYYRPDGSCFWLLKAWQLKDGQATPLAEDDLLRVSQGKSEYNGMDEIRFVAAIRSAIQAPPQ
jgi:hypothetical protein